MSWTKEKLVKLYKYEKKSAKEIADAHGCSEGKVNYWLKKYSVSKRSISDAVYQKANPSGDPFISSDIDISGDSFLYGLGLGLYWGEGTKKDTHSVRLGNTDPALIKSFLYFLDKAYSIDKQKLRFGLQIFSDMNPKKALEFWSNELGFPKSQFYKVIVTPERSIGTYRQKTKHGVLTVYFNNKKLRDIICNKIDELKEI